MSVIHHKFNIGDTVFRCDYNSTGKQMDTKPYIIRTIEIMIGIQHASISYSLSPPGYDQAFISRHDESLIFKSFAEGQKAISVDQLVEPEPPSSLAKKFRRRWVNNGWKDEMITS